MVTYKKLMNSLLGKLKESRIITVINFVSCEVLKMVIFENVMLP